ncbi:PDR/VanB family oxidoreductase [Burkholderia ambifaria]|uniref:PDR/VanB family oxidoreductase n=1 Tax=Burkholderia ambifaria TaxID=152480 RepID=UPI002FE1F251
MKVLVKSKKLVANGIAAFKLVAPGGEQLPLFSAGAHIDVFLGNDLVRQYSLCNAPSDRSHYQIGVLLEPNSRGGSRAMHNLAEGQLIEISEPKNHFPLIAGARRSVLMAGGIGITPILAMAEHLREERQDFDLHYCVRDHERAAFRERVEHDDFSPHARLYYDTAPSQERVKFSEVLRSPDPDVHLYVCGPGGFIDAVIKEATSAGWGSENVHREYFGNAPTSGEGDLPFQLRLARSGKIVEVRSDQTAAQALAAHGIDIQTSCEQGVCGTCMTKVLEGVPDHRDVYMTDEEHAANDQFTPCCSRAKTPLLIDL